MGVPIEIEESTVLMIRNLLLTILLLPWGAAFSLEPDKLYEKLSPSVWVVWVYDSEAVKISSGSAVVIGHEELVTNCHVLSKGKSISIKRENTLHGARLLHADVDRDLCILSAKGLMAPPVEVAALKSIRIGQRAYAIGAPRGYELTLSDGLVSSFKRDQDEQITAIQMSVPISPGSSGGGLFDADGKLIGIPSQMRTDAQNLNFAIPAEWIREVPQRAKLALEKLRSQEAASAVSGNKAAPGTPNGPGRQLVGEELRAHFVNLGSVAGNTPSGANIRLNIGTDGKLDVRNLDKGGYTAGTYEIDEAGGQICFVVYQQRWKMMQVCYRLFEIGANKFAMRSVSDRYFFTYSKL